MSKSMQLQSLFAGLALAMFLSGCDVIEPVSAQDYTSAHSSTAQATVDQPDHP